MELTEFKRTIEVESAPPAELSLPLQALWWDAKGDWAKAHDLCQAAHSPDGDWVHAYLHHVEGDEGNASYWYSRAGRPVYDGNVKDEWSAIARELLVS